MTSLRHDVLTSLAGEAGYFDELDSGTGPVGSHAWLLSMESDARWESRYHKFTRGDNTIAIVPVYQRKAKEWRDPLYTPDFPVQPDSPVTPECCVLVGGRDRLLSSLHVQAEAREPEVYRAIMEALTEAYCQSGRYLYFPHFRAAELSLIAAASDTPPQRRLTGADARLDRLLGDWGKSLLSKERATLRHDLAEGTRLGVRTAVCDWADATDYAAPLIAGHHQAKGSPEHSLLVDRRVRQWERCTGFEVMVFTAQAEDVRGVVVAAVWRDWMELLEIGLGHGRGEVRRCVYAYLIAHLPAEAGKARGLRKLRVGPAARTPKAARGAFFHELESALVAL